MRQRKFPWVPAAAAGVCLALIVLFVMDRATPPATSLDADDRVDASSGAGSEASLDETLDRERLLPPPLRPGHGITWRDRARAAAGNAEEVRVAVRRSTNLPEWREGSMARDDEIPDLVIALRKRLPYSRFLRILYRVEDPVAVVRRALNGVADPIARQNLIFHMAIALPPAEAFEFLRGIRETGDEADREDALCAAAFRGDPDAVEDFRVLALEPSGARVRRAIVDAHDHGELVEDGERDVLRSYRCIETLDAGPYFRTHAMAYHDGEAIFPWAHRDRGDVEARARLLLPAWRNRYPGHSGSDDMAYRLSNLAMDAGDDLGALRWA
ncbi:MAG: hypothetical protein ACYTDX_05490, partial [Planctomycetota bacterium]